jgi:4-hydroxythreonine-4-phosphate dehydrogenase
MKKPVIAITMGDAGGIGPEISLLAATDAKVREACKPVIVGSAAIIRKASDVLGNVKKIMAYSSIYDLDPDADAVAVLDDFELDESFFAAGGASAVTGKAAVHYMDVAAEMCMSGCADAIASAPLNKHGMELAGYHFAGATEYFAHLTKTAEYAMVLFFGPIKMFYATNHVSLREALDSIDEETVFKKLVFIDKIIKSMGEQKLLIAVAAINPHAGENGKMGREETEILGPAIENAQRAGLSVEGPVPADTLFIKAKEGMYGAVLAMFHDQGNIAAKLMDFGSGVTYISGLPIIRTSVAHGTAYDIAGKGLASADTMKQAVLKASSLSLKRSMNQ